MFDFNDKQRVKDVLSKGLGINPNINLAYYLNAIDDTNQKVARFDSKLDEILYNQNVIDRKLNKIISLIQG